MFIKKSKSIRLQVKYFVLVGAVCLFFFLYRLMHDRTAAEKSLSEASNEIAELKKMKKAAVDELLLLKQSTMIAPQQSIGQELDSEKCRDIFKARGKGGLGELTQESIESTCKDTLIFDVCSDLKRFSGLSDDEFMIRMMRKGRFHFEGEHQFWNPTSTTELAWYYVTSIDYLFANAIHKAQILPFASKEYEPILDYSGGVGNNMIYLAKKGIKVQYFGIGMAEYKFAEYRVWKHGLEDLVQFMKPYHPETFVFDPINGPLPQDGSLGAIIAQDVLEHIPNYHIVVKAMVDSIRVGGVIYENTPFSQDELPEGEEDLRVHVSNGGITMNEAMGPRMKKENSLWRKIAE